MPAWGVGAKYIAIMERVQIGFSVYFPDKKEGFFSIMRDRNQASTLTRLNRYSLVSVEGKN